MDSLRLINRLASSLEAYMPKRTPEYHSLYTDMSWNFMFHLIELYSDVKYKNLNMVMTTPPLP